MEPAAPSMTSSIEALLNASSPTLAAVEDTLIEGYARALALEAERLRLERRLGEMAPCATSDHSDELRSLGTRLTTTDGELEELRSLLGSLLNRARVLRAAAPS